MENKRICTKCNGELRHHDTVKRIVIGKRGVKKTILVEKLKCKKCGHTVRILPEGIYPHKHYEADIIEGVAEGLIDECTLGFEDYPSDMTMKRWRAGK